MRKGLLGVAKAAELAGVPRYQLTRWARWRLVPGARMLRGRWWFERRKLVLFIDGD